MKAGEWLNLATPEIITPPGTPGTDPNTVCLLVTMTITATSVAANSKTLSATSPKNQVAGGGGGGSGGASPDSGGAAGLSVDAMGFCD